MGDDELAEIRNKRMAEMRAQAGGAGGDQQQQMQERAKQMEDMKNGILSQVLDQKVQLYILVLCRVIMLTYVLQSVLEFQ